MMQNAIEVETVEVCLQWIFFIELSPEIFTIVPQVNTRVLYLFYLSSKIRDINFEIELRHIECNCYWFDESSLCGNVQYSFFSFFCIQMTHSMKKSIILSCLLNYFIEKIN
jgi:hypothetical protein